MRVPPMRNTLFRLVVTFAALILVPAAPALAGAPADVATGATGPTHAAASGPTGSAATGSTAASGDNANTSESADAAAGKPFTFFGSGFGHGLGMSQWGAYGLAQDGWSATKILAHYYSGTTVGRDDGPSNLRVGLTQGRSAIALEASSGAVKLRLGDPRNGDVVATIPNGETWHVRVATNHYRIVDADGNTVDRVGGPNSPIFAVYEPIGARVHIPEAGHTYNRGYVEFGLTSCQSSCSMRLVLVISPQEYLFGLGEVPSSWPMAAMQAQAVAARTYAFTKAASSQHRSGCDCAVYASSLDQVYAGWDKEGATDGDRWVHAVTSTNGQVVKNGGHPIQAFYMSSSGGFTEDNENVWGGSPVSYLRGVCDPGDFTTANPSATWDVTMTAGSVTQDLGLGIGTVTGFANARRGVSGRIVSITVHGQDGDRTISGATLRSALALRDDRLWINTNRQIVGAIRTKYDALGCAPGLPTSRQVDVAGGRRQTFEDATIYWSAATHAREVHGSVLAAYLDAGGPGGRLGFPVTDTHRLNNGHVRSGFEHGTITCGDTTCVVRST
jgi:stage II sporulation protein D